MCHVKQTNSKTNWFFPRNRALHVSGITENTNIRRGRKQKKKNPIMVQKCKQIYCGNIKVTFEQNGRKGKSEKKNNLLTLFTLFKPF